MDSLIQLLLADQEAITSILPLLEVAQQIPIHLIQR